MAAEVEMAPESIDRVFAAAEDLAEPGKPVAVMVVHAGRLHVARVVVGGEPVAHAAADTRAAALGYVLAELERQAAAQRVVEASAVADGASW
jgi:hypothetical protein